MSWAHLYPYPVPLIIWCAQRWVLGWLVDYSCWPNGQLIAGGADSHISTGLGLCNRRLQKPRHGNWTFKHSSTLRCSNWYWINYSIFHKGQINIVFVLIRKDTLWKISQMSIQLDYTLSIYLTKIWTTAADLKVFLFLYCKHSIYI